MAGIGTLSVHAGNNPDEWKCKAMWPPIVTSTTYKRSIVESSKEQEEGISSQYTYIRSTNPTRECLEKSLARLEEAEYGFVTNSGSTAIAIILQSLLSSGDNIVVAENVYFGSNILMTDVFSKYKITASFVNVLNGDPETIESAITERTKLLWIDFPCNPSVELIDIQKISDIAHKKDCLLVVDNTLATPYFTRPLSLGADIVMHSGTKYLNGHSDVLMGVICTSNTIIAEKIRNLLTTIGAVPSPFDCYLANRSLRTLHVRMKAHAENALAVAKYLESSQFVDSVSYPGLPSHPQHELAKKLFSNDGYGGMLSFKIKGDLETAKRFLKSLKIFTMAVSLGSLESIAGVCTIMTHKAMKKEDKLRIGITDNLIRLSIGLEDVDDIINDLEQALEAAELS
ncbi:PREDICTED: cystathionine gamma-lyase-like [Amphimedon queenslandica]|uniref:cystathionine gamma-lyase n=1 Tax=Amphimedon queenslandica TaxID=400682 RepID=A0A1X7UIC1_AMPQE|nr:PREDICTED: cystathionine gamma-lyase-like [Amphimedon queenslandica]|eukprot:XP_003387879.1 PREDICTED: cystathionine gamma-lyase-like [Amphimedon queenslandica]